VRLDRPYLFAGPTLARAQAMRPELDLGAVEVQPPIQRGDLPRLARAAAPGVFVIVDGLFHHTLPVGHAEIRQALGAGWQVWGLSSMGAIRAREMRHLGMRGYGEVYALYCQDGVDFRDDEVTLLHDPDPPFREISEPLVHLRFALAHLRDRGALAGADHDAIIGELMEMWFGERTLGWLRERLRPCCPDEAVVECFRSFDRFRCKPLDLLKFMDERPWLQAASERSRNDRTEST
jgi:hypothetical protein